MHYKNGREAKNGDRVIFLGAYGGPVIGILHNATAGNDFCNGNLALIAEPVCPNLAECLHVDDLMKALPPEVPDSSE